MKKFVNNHSQNADLILVEQESVLKREEQKKRLDTHSLRTAVMELAIQGGVNGTKIFVR